MLLFGKGNAIAISYFWTNFVVLPHSEPMKALQKIIFDISTQVSVPLTIYKDPKQPRFYLRVTLVSGCQTSLPRVHYVHRWKSKNSSKEDSMSIQLYNEKKLEI